MAEEGSEQSGPVNITPLEVVYCPVCSLPPEYCEYGPSYEECLPWIRENMPELLGDSKLAEAVDNLTIADEKGEGDEGEGEGEGEGDGEKSGEAKKKKKRGGGPKKKEAPLTKVVISKTNRNKKKFVTSIVGLETVPDVKLKVAAKLLGKHFACGASVSETAAGASEIVIQGDVLFDLPEVLVAQLNVPLDVMFFSENGRESPVA